MLYTFKRVQLEKNESFNFGCCLPILTIHTLDLMPDLWHATVKSYTNRITEIVNATINKMINIVKALGCGSDFCTQITDQVNLTFLQFVTR